MNLVQKRFKIVDQPSQKKNISQKLPYLGQKRFVLRKLGKTPNLQ